MNTTATATRLSLLFVISLFITSSFSQKQLYVNDKIDTSLINSLAVNQHIIQAQVSRLGEEFDIELYATLNILGYHYLVESGPGFVSEINKFLKDELNLYLDTTSYPAFYRRLKQIGVVSDIQYYGIELSYFVLGLYVLNNWNDFANNIGDKLLYQLSTTYSKYNQYTSADNMEYINRIYKKIDKTNLKKDKKDEDIKNIVEKQGNVKEYDKEIKDLLKKAKDEDVKNYPKVKSIIYVDGKEILKRDLTITNKDKEKVRIQGTNVIDDGVQVDYKVSAPGEDGGLTLKGKSTGKDEISDKYDLEIKENSYSTTTLKLDNKSKVDGDKRTDKGTVTLTPSTGSKFDLNYENNLTTDVKNNEQKQKFNISFEQNGEPIKLMIDGKTELKKDIKFKKDGAVDFNTLSSSEVDDIGDEVQDKFEDIVKDVTNDIN